MQTGFSVGVVAVAALVLSAIMITASKAQEKEEKFTNTLFRPVLGMA